jgi:hypothetical protein
MFADQVEKVKFRGEEFDQFHGSPFDRGSADSYYGRGQDPHWWPQGTYKGTRVESQDMSMAQLRAYYAGYDFNEEFGDKKNWG